MIRQTLAFVDLAAIEGNLRAIRQSLEGAAVSRLDFAADDSHLPARASRLAPRVIAVVKANAYGHGAVEVGLALERAGAAMLACADIEEGIVLRRGGVSIPILVFGALGISDLDGICEYSLTPTISTPSAARSLARVAAGFRRTQAGAAPLRYHLKIDTGMNRLGFRFDNLERTLPELAASTDLQIEAAYTHFATADDPESTHFPQQRERFERALQTLAQLGFTPPLRHAANSAALLRDERTWYDFVRPGLLLYGVVPPPFASTLPLRPALSLRSRIVHVKGVRAGEGTGYGLKTTFDRPSTIAIVPAGYADGLDRRLAGNGQMLVRGQRVPVVGSVCMDMTMIDVTGMDVSPGDEVVIVGAQQGESIGVREIAAAIGTIPYELLCRVGTRIERVYENP
jgi:alanine racemase